MIQPLAYVHPDAKIAKNVVIEPFTTISKNVEIGEGTWIGPNVTIMEGARIGKNCKIFPGAVISAIPQDLKYKGEETTTHIGDNTTIRECVTINKGTVDRMRTVVGNNCLIGHVTVGNCAVMAGMTAVYQFCSIGSYAFVTGGSLVGKDVPPYVKAARNPLSYVGVNSIGLHRRGFSTEKIREIQDIYRILFQKKLSTSHALEYIEAEMEATVERDEILQFVRRSQHGIMKGYHGELIKD